MSSILKHKINNEALKYTTAVAQLNLLANAPSHAGSDYQKVRQAVGIIKSNLKYLKARRLQFVHNNLILRKSIENKIRQMTLQERKLFIRQLRAEPRKVLELFGVRNSLSEMKYEESHVRGTYIKLLNIAKEKILNELKESKPVSVTGGLPFIAEKKADLENKIKELEKRKEEAESKFISALVAGVVQIVEEITSNEGISPPSEEPPAPEESTTEIVDISGYEECMNRAAQSLESCQSNCLPGEPGNSCRGLCYATYLVDIAKCAAGS